MKKSLIGTLACGLALIASSSVSAEIVGTPLGTIADVQFEVDTDPETEIVVPNEKEEQPEIIELPGEGASGKGPLRIEFVPHLRFGTSTNMTAGSESKAAKTLTYNFKNESTKTKIAPFVQVRDGRGLVGTDARWGLTVTATPFTATAANADGTDDVLANCKIILSGSKLTMDYGSTSKADGLIRGQDAKAEILTDGQTATLVMATKTGQSTSGHRVSNVFDTGYTKGKVYIDEKAEGIEFYKPAGQAPIANVSYASKLVWTLTDAF